MKKSIRYTTILLLALSLTACEKFLDIKTDSKQVFIETANDCQLVLDNYSRMNVGYPADGELSADDYFLMNTNYLSGSSATDNEDRLIHTWNATSQRATAAVSWKPSYFIIYNANLVLEAIDKGLKDSPDQATLDGLRGSALFFRAWSLWQVAQLYCRPYVAATAGIDPGVPIRLTSDINEVSSRNTVQQVYERIVTDLREALVLLPTTSQIASRPNKIAANAMLARVYLSMEDYGQAQASANAALQLKSNLINYNTLSLTSTTPFVRFNDEVIFQSVMATSTKLNPGSSTGPVARIAPELSALYADNDLRKGILIKPNTVRINVQNPPPATTTTGVDYPDGTYRFGGNYEQVAGATLFNGLAVDELYLIRAEGHARSGNGAAALADLNTLLSTRWKTGTYVALSTTDPSYDTADEVLAKVLQERRKELVMRGQRWTDLRRLNRDPRFKKDLTRDVRTLTAVPSGTYSATNNPVTYTVALNYTINASYSLPANDPRYTLLIPQEVITNAGLPQNPRN